MESPMKWAVVATLLITLSLLTDARLPRHLKFNRLRRHRDNSHLLQQDPATLLSEKWFKQKLDHFNDKEKSTWNQRYWQNDKYVKGTGDLNFLNIGGEGAESPAWVTNELYPMVTSAKKLGARLWNVEHRFYGASHPTRDLSTKNLKYLDSRQALADLADFIVEQNKKLSIKNPKWIVFGGSYPGNLVLWFRQQYPDLTVGGIGSSAPINAVTDFYDYLRVCEDSYTTYDPKCASLIQEGFNALRNAFDYKDGRDNLDTAFDFYPSLASQNLTFTHIQNAYSSIMGNFMVAVQYSRVNAGIFKSGASIPDVCRVMKEPAFNPIARLVKVNQYMEKEFGESGDYTFDSYEDDVEFLSDTSWNDAADSRSWTWQTCNEFGYFQSTDYTGIFGVSVPVDFYYNLCTDVFGKEINVDYTQQKVRETLEHYGRPEKYNATNVVIPNGSLDPWHALGTYTQNNPTAIPFLITGTAHCADMEPEGPNDVDDLKKVRKLVFQKLQEWSGVSVESVNENRASRFTSQKSSENVLPQKSSVVSEKKAETRIVVDKDAKIELKSGETLADVEQKTIAQKVDHFDDGDSRVFKQTFLVNKKYYKQGGPVFLLLSTNKADAKLITNEKLPVVQWAQKFNGALVELEQRFYGDSQPTGKIDTKSLSYLTIDQSLSDASTLISSLSTSDFSSSKWIVYGGDFSGALAAWLRQFKPDLVHGAVTSGAPFLATLDFYGHYQSIQESVQQYNQTCYANLKAALDQVHWKLTTVEGRNDLNTKLKLDPKFTTNILDPYDVFSFYSNLLIAFSTEVQFGDLVPIDIKFLCDALNNNAEKDLILRLFNARWETSVNTKYAWQLTDLEDDSLLSNEERLRFWLQCNEFGLFTTTNMGYNVFGSGLGINYHLRLCNDAFSTNFTRDQLEAKILATNDKYGGTENFKSSRVVNLYGTYDPWKKLAIYPISGDHGEDVDTILIKGTSHTADMLDPDQTRNPQNIKNALSKVQDYLTKWLK